MAKKFLVLTLVFLFNMINLQAQKKEEELNINQKKKIILFLIDTHQFETDTSEWKKYLDAIEYKQIYSNPQSTNKIYTFSSTSFHALTFFLIKEGSNEVFLGSQYSTDNIKVLMNFFMRNSNMNSKALLKSISKIIDVYQLNETSGSKIPVAPN
jgi:hypothetical protein